MSWQLERAMMLQGGFTMHGGNVLLTVFIQPQDPRELPVLGQALGGRCVLIAVTLMN
jgi:hypothetical protein